MNRKQLYNEIISLGLQKEIQSRYGKNYTTCTSAQLQTVVDEVHKSMSTKVTQTEVEPTEVKSSAFQKLVEILAKKRILLKSEVTEIMKS